MKPEPVQCELKIFLVTGDDICSSDDDLLFDMHTQCSTNSGISRLAVSADQEAAGTAAMQPGFSTTTKGENA